MVNLHPDPEGPTGQPWDKVVLTVTSSNSQGAVTLEGGNDVGTSDSVFHLVKFLTPADCSNPITGEGGGTNVTIHLLESSGVCPDKGYALNVTSRSITFETSGNGGAPGQWIVDVNDWSPEPAINPVPATTVFPPANGELAVWCDGNYTPNSGGTLGATMPNGHSWCLIHQEASIAGVISGVQQMQVNELYLLEGDAVLCRKCT